MDEDKVVPTSADEELEGGAVESEELEAEGAAEEEEGEEDDADEA